MPALTLALAALLAASPAAAGAREAGPVGRHQDPGGGTSSPYGSVGLLIMAHGGEPEWDRSVRAALAKVAARLPAEVAFGMADAESLQAAVARLEERGVRRIAVVRLFISGDSFKERTERILGLRAGAPPRPEKRSPHAHHGPHRHHDPESMPLWRIATQARFALSEEGLLDSDRVGTILAERALALSREPGRESVLILGHGPGSDAENARWLERMRRLAEGVARAGGFRDVRVDTLREDWPEKRRAAEERIRAYVAAASREGRALVIPLRLSGFGPYAEVLKGLSYVSDGKGLLPHAEVEAWIEEQLGRAAAGAGWPDPLAGRGS